MVVTTDEMKQIKSKGYADIGGIPKTTYWTPDGREIKAFPCMRTFVMKKDGKVIGDGVRDANLDKGWLTQKPTELKLTCTYCDKWHDTKEEITQCGAKHRAFDEKWAEKARKMKKDESNDLKSEVEELKSDMTEIKSMLMKLLEKK